MVKNELGKQTQYAYDEYSRLKSVTNPLGHTILYEYGNTPGCGCGHTNAISRITTPEGRMTTFTYDGADRPKTKTVGANTPDAATESWQYSDVPERITRTDGRGKPWMELFDQLHRRISSSDPLGNKTEWTYYPNGRKKTEKRPGVTALTEYLYDQGDRLWKVTNPAGEVTEWTYTADNQIATIKDAKQQVYAFGYDLLARKTSLQYPDQSVEAWTYDKMGNVATYTTRAGQVKTAVFNNRNREMSYTWSDASDAVARTYDNGGRLLTLENKTSILSYTYDDANQMLSEMQQIKPDSISYIVSYAYDKDGNRQALTYPDGVEVGYEYTARSQMKRLTFKGGSPAAEYLYDLSGNRTGRLLDNATATAYTYDDANRLENIVHTAGGPPNPVLLASFGYGYTPAGLRKYVQRQDGHGDSYRYDATDQLDLVRYEVPNPQGPDPAGAVREVAYDYDPVGNREVVTEDGAGTTYTANNLNQYTTVGGSTLMYDGNGNLTGQSGWSYQYDAQNRLISATDGSMEHTFAYDGRNRCVIRVSQPLGSELFPPPLIHFYYEGWHLIEERNWSSDLLAQYVHGPSTDDLVARLSQRSSAATYYYADALGSTVVAADASGYALERYSYDVFGAPEISDSMSAPLMTSAYNTRFLFTGREWLAELGLYDYRNRVYAPRLGRFLQTDPRRFAARDLNLYRYVSNTPVMATDPTGLTATGKGCSRSECNDMVEDIYLLCATDCAAACILVPGYFECLGPCELGCGLAQVAGKLACRACPCP